MLNWFEARTAKQRKPSLSSSPFVATRRACFGGMHITLGLHVNPAKFADDAPSTDIGKCRRSARSGLWPDAGNTTFDLIEGRIDGFCF